MKKIMLVTAVALLVGGYAGRAQALDISFDGFCDGMHLDPGDDTTLGGHRTGCSTGDLIGNGLDVVAPMTDGVAGRNFIYVLNLAAGSFCNYGADNGAPPARFVCGTFSFGTPAAAVGASSTSGN